MSISNQPCGQREKAAVRKEQALALRIQGKSYRSIASELQVSVGCVHKDIAGSLVALARKQTEQTERLRQLELERIDRALELMWPHLDRVAIVDRWVKLIDLRAKLLGLYAPQKLEHSGDAGPVTTIEVRLRDSESETGKPSVEPKT